MPIDASIYSLGQPQPFVNPFDTLTKVRAQQQQLQIGRQQIASNQALEEERRQKVAKEAQVEADQQKFFAIIGSSKDADEAAEKIRVGVPSMYQAFLKQRSDLDNKGSEITNTAAEVKKLTAEVKIKGSEYAEPFFQLVEKSGYQPSVLEFALSHIQSHFPDFPADEYRQIAQGGPDAIKQLVDSRKSTQQQNADVTAASGAAKLPGEVAASQIAQQVAAGTQGGLTPQQQAEAARAAEAAKEAARHNRTQEGFEGQRLAQAANDKTELTPEGLDAAAMMFAKTGVLPALGMGDKKTRKDIINRSAVLVPGLDIASAKADYEANRKSLDNIGGTLDTLESFSKAAGKNLDQFVKIASKLPDTGVPWANTPLRQLNDKLVGAEWAPAVNAARAVATREVARITGDPKLKGVLSDAARHEVEQLVPGDITFAQLKRVIPILQADMANVHESLGEQKAAIQARIKLGATPPAKEPAATAPQAAPAGSVKMQAPDGTIAYVTADHVDAAKAKGAKVVP